ncbi:MAG: phage holin family protein [Proteobacteria bacterium]|nr:phage holin family protein [Pseudomonadota bacterium]
MRLTDVAQSTVSHIVGRLIRRAALFAALGLLAIVTLYYASAAGTVALALEYGPIYAYLIMAGIYALAAIVVVIALLATRPKALPPQDKIAGALSSPRNMQIAMLVEAVMLGYTLARKSGGKSLL